MRVPAFIRRSLILVLFASGMTLFTRAGTAAELIMYEQEGCFACDLWKRQVGQTYPLTKEAKLLPLRMIDIHAKQPADLAFLGHIRFTPYFAVVHEGRKIGQIYGYNNEAAFYGMLGEIVEILKAGKNSALLVERPGKG